MENQQITLETLYKAVQNIQQELHEIKEKIEDKEAEKIRVAIVGGGYSGVELACKLADRLGDIGRIRLIEKGENEKFNIFKFTNN